MRDAIIITLILALAVVVPLLIRLIGNKVEAGHSNDATDTNDNGGTDSGDSESNNDWPSVIYSAESPLNDPKSEQAIAIALAQERILRLLR
jgi:hypothetical protein